MWRLGLVGLTYGRVPVGVRPAGRSPALAEDLSDGRGKRGEWSVTPPVQSELQRATIFLPNAMSRGVSLGLSRQFSA